MAKLLKENESVSGSETYHHFQKYKKNHLGLFLPQSMRSLVFKMCLVNIWHKNVKLKMLFDF